MNYNYTIEGFDNIPIKQAVINLLEINNYPLLDTIQYELYRKNQTDDEYGNEKIHLYSGDEYLQYTKDVVLIPEILLFDLDNKSIQAKLQKTFMGFLTDVEYRQLDEINYSLNLIVSELVNKFDISLSFAEQINVSEYVKLKKIRVDTEIDTNYFEKILQVLEVTAEFMNDQLVIVYNLLPHLSRKDVHELSEFVKIKESNILLIERDINIDKEDLSNLLYTKIDNDLVMFQM